MTDIVFRCFACKHGKCSWCNSRSCECDHGRNLESEQANPSPAAETCSVCGRREVEHSPRNAFMPGRDATDRDAPASPLDTSQGRAS